MVESLLIYGAASLAASAAESGLGLEDDYGLSHVAGHAFHDAVAGGVKKLRETFRAHRPDRNHDLIEACHGPGCKLSLTWCCRGRKKTGRERAAGAEGRESTR